MELLLSIEVLHGGAMDADNVTNGGDHRQVLLTLRVDDHSRIDRRGRIGISSLVVQGVIHHLNCADETPLLRLVGVARVYNHSEEVELILVGRICVRILERSVDIVALKSDGWS